MIVAREKKKDNIVEYILYMWQVEDLIRANQLRMDLIDKHIIAKYDQPADTILETREWWENLVEMMKLERKQEAGHLQVNINIVNDIHQLHMALLKKKDEMSYQYHYQMAVPYIQEFEHKSAAPYDNDIELCLTAIYSSFLLKLQGKEVGQGTQEALACFGKFLSLLSARYKLDQEGKLEKE
ncbi:MAG: DUF4924 family protein [Breznakibacter sp.]